MKNFDKKVETLIEIINTMNPEKYFKFKFQDFCADLFFSGDEPGAFSLEDDFVGIWEALDKADIIHEGEQRDLFMDSFTYAVFIFHSYVDFCLKTAYVSRNNMKRFSDKISSNYFNDDFPNIIFEYYRYIKRNGNSDLEKETIIKTEEVFKFFNDLGEFQFSFKGPSDMEFKEDVNQIGDTIKTSYICFINTLCLSFSNFINFLNSQSIANELSES